MTDRELLELAAKATEQRVVFPITKSGKDAPMIDTAEGGLYSWNPLTDDGDALRLAVKMRIDVKHYDDYVVCWFDGGYIGSGKIMCGDDPQAATRRAIVRAAASIGKVLP